MTIQTERIDKQSVVLFLAGRLDTAAAPLLERKIKQFGDDISDITLDFLDLDYISSMGLRVLLQAQKSMKARGCSMVIRNMSAMVREVFEMTGFINLMVQEEKFVIIKKNEEHSVVLSLIGRLDCGNITDVERELSALKEEKLSLDETFTITLNMEKLSPFTEEVCRKLKTAVDESEWPKRTLTISGASRELRELFQKEGMEHFLAEKSPMLNAPLH